MHRYIYDKDNKLRAEIPDFVFDNLMSYKAGSWEKYNRKDGAVGNRYIIQKDDLALNLGVLSVKLYFRAGDYVV